MRLKYEPGTGAEGGGGEARAAGGEGGRGEARGEGGGEGGGGEGSTPRLVTLAVGWEGRVEPRAGFRVQGSRLNQVWSSRFMFFILVNFEEWDLSSGGRD